MEGLKCACYFSRTMCSVICNFEVNQEFLTDPGEKNKRKKGGREKVLKAVSWLVVEQKIKLHFA